MRITAYTDYSLRVLIYLAVRGDELVTIREIAGAYAISHNHLMKVTHRLQLEGFVQTVRGKAGGMTLARPAEKIRVGEVVRAMEPDFTLVECFGPDNRCVIAPSCSLTGVLARALQAFLGELDRCTLADLVAGSTAGLRRDLGWQGA